MKHIIAYDIENNKRRNKLAKLLSEFGIRIQFSVFECTLTKKELAYLNNTISDLIKKDKDSVFIFPICQNCDSKGVFIGATISERRVSFIEI